MSYVGLGYGSSSGGGGSGIVAVPQDADAPGPGARVWLHNNFADLHTIYTPVQIYPADTSTDPATADPRSDLTVARSWQFSDATPNGYGVNLPMQFATSEQAENIDDDAVFYERTVMRFTRNVTAKFRFVITLTSGSFRHAAAMSFRKITDETDDSIILSVNQQDPQALSSQNDEDIDIVGSASRYRPIIMDVPWALYEPGDLYYAYWDSEGAAGGFTHAYCQAEYVVH